MRLRNLCFGAIVFLTTLAGTLHIYADTADYSENYNGDVSVSDSEIGADVNLNSFSTSYPWEYSLTDSKVTLTKYTGSSANITIPSTINGYTVTKLNSYLFNNNTTITSVTIPKNIETIGNSAFYGCTGLTSVSIANGVKSIGSYAFDNCSNSNFKSLVIPGSVTDIGIYAFSNCTGLTDVTINKSTSNSIGGCDLGNGAFFGDTNLKNITLGAGIKKINAYTFTDCKALGEIKFTTDITAIDSGAFSGCTSLSSVTIPSNIKTIGNRAFENCTGIKALNIEDGVQTIGSYAFYDCSNSNFKTIVIPGSVQSVGECAFAKCTGIKLVTIKKSINNAIGKCVLGSCVFQNDTALTNVLIEEGVTSIGLYAFDSCTKLVYVFLPDSVEKMEVFSNATPFDGCKNAVLYVYKGSYSETFAKKYNLAYKYQPLALGDINGDDNVASVTDISILQRYIIGKIVLNDTQLEAADVNKSGSVTIIDLSKMQKYCIGKITSF